VRLWKAVMTENEIAKEIVDAAFRIHTTLGPGLLESVYDAVLAHELGRRGLRTARQQPIPVIYDNVRIDIGFRADLIVEDKLIVEIKSVEVLAPVHKKQLLTYLRLADKRLGLLINFHVAFIKEGIARVVNGLEDETHGRVGERATRKCDPLSPRRTGQADFPASGSPENVSSQACAGSCAAAGRYKRTSPNRWICS
jgi:GxxExxY protein